MIENKEYLNNIKEAAKKEIPWEKLKNKTFLITGATGLIGKFLIDLLMYKNKNEELNCKIIAIGRNKTKAKERLDYFEDKNFVFIESNINEETISDIGVDKLDYVLHAASSTHPLQYSNEPINTIMANVTATKNMLDLANSYKSDRFVFLSSVEIYGENRGDVDKFDESYLGYIDCNTLRAGYPESKRTGEALCQAYIKEKNMDIVIPRLSRVFGPTILKTDSKALSQFINKGVIGEDIVLKSEGNQYYSYLYVADAVMAILYVMFFGNSGEAYNCSSEKFDITLKDLATIIADIAGKKVVFELPDENERKGYSTATKAILDSSKIEKLGFSVEIDIKQRLKETVDILKSMN